MTATSTATDRLAEPHPPDIEPAEADDERRADLSLTLGEVVALAAVLTVGSVGGVALALAQIGQHDGWLSVVIGTLLGAALAGVAVVVGGRPSVEVDKVEIGLVAATLLAAGLLFLPGYPYAYGDKDPGAYVNHGFAIAREGDVAIRDDIKATGLATPDITRGSFPGVRPAYGDPDASTSQFFHYTSALMATAADLAGRRGLFNMTPLLAMLSVTVFVLAARRAAGTRVAAVLAALLIVNMMQVWQAKYPSTEIPAQFVLAATLLAAVLAIDRKWAGGAFVAGAMTGLSFLVRPDGFLYILLAAGVAAIAIAAGRIDRRVVALGIGVGAILPAAFWNAYELRAHYVEVNDVPGPTVVLAAVVGMPLAGWAVHYIWQRGRWTPPIEMVRRWRKHLGVVGAALFGIALLVLWNRTTLLGQPSALNPFTGTTERNLAEANLHWLSLYVTLPGLVIMWVGLAVALVRRSRLSLYLLLLPGTMLLPLYLWNARVSMRMMWWVRRYVPAVVPAIILLIALGLVWALWHRYRPLRVAGLVAFVGLMAFSIGLSYPLREHREMRGSWEMAAGVAAPAGDDDGVFMFAAPASGNLFDPLRNVPLGVWWAFGHTAAWLPTDYDMTTIEAYREAFPDRPLFLVVPDQIPESLPEDRFELAGVAEAELTHWEEWPWGLPAEGEPTHRPDHDLRTPQRLAVWRLVE